jgi:hypothetical protein
VLLVGGVQGDRGGADEDVALGGLGTADGGEGGVGGGEDFKGAHGGW